MEIFNITPKTFSGEIIAPPAKSFAHRILICAFLSNKEITVRNIGDSVDVFATLSALQTMGAQVEKIDGGVKIKKTQISSDKLIINCFESGSTLRFLLPVACALGLKAEFTGKGKLLERPVKELVDVINRKGAKIRVLLVDGKLSSGVYEIAGNISSQYITGLMLALSVIDGESEIIIKGETVSKPYIDITLSVLNDFGVKVTKTENGYKIVGGYNPKTNDITVEGDWSGSAFPLSLGAINGNVTISGLNLSSVQGDRKIIDILKSFGATVIENGDKVTVKKSNLKGIETNVENVPDLSQVIAVLGAYASGETKLYGVERLKLKESDRIQAILSTLSVAGVNAEYDGEKITVHGGKVTGGKFDGGKDHRTVMSAVVLASGAETGSKIIDAKYYEKSYPTFVSDYKKLGGEINVEI